MSTAKYLDSRAKIPMLDSAHEVFQGPYKQGCNDKIKKCCKKAERSLHRYRHTFHQLPVLTKFWEG